MSKKFAKDALGTRMKRYEIASDFMLTRRTCLIVRVDGQAFHTYTKGFERPFDGKIMGCMQYAAVKLAESMSGFKAGYIQSDEASFLLTDYDAVNTQAWFDNSLNKLVSIPASTMTAHFNYWMLTNFKVAKLATFDARAFVVPEADVANYFLWRSKDWERNSLSMYEEAFHRQRACREKAQRPARTSPRQGEELDSRPELADSQRHVALQERRWGENHLQRRPQVP